LDVLGATFVSLRTHLHIKTNKKCLSSRPTINFSCVWCNEEFISNVYLDSTKRKVNKEQKYIDLITTHNYMLEDKDKKTKIR
jgi:hypothetical protein